MDYLRELKNQLETEFGLNVKRENVFFTELYENDDCYFVKYRITKGKKVPLVTGGIDGLQIRKSDNHRESWNSYFYELANGDLSKTLQKLEVPKELQIPEDYDWEKVA